MMLYDYICPVRVICTVCVCVCVWGGGGGWALVISDRDHNLIRSSAHHFVSLVQLLGAAGCRCNETHLQHDGIINR